MIPFEDYSYLKSLNKITLIILFFISIVFYGKPIK